MKQLCIYLMIIVLMVSFAACGVQESVSDKTERIPKPTETLEQTDALSVLRADMKPPIIAVADFGFPELSEEFGIMDYLVDVYPKWMEEHDFVRNIPEERIVRICDYNAWSQLFCIVPRDPAATVCVNVTRYMEEEPFEAVESEVVYRSESGDPILLLTDVSESVMVTVMVTDNESRGVSWDPYWGAATPVPENGYYGALVMDFTPSSEQTPYDFALSQGWCQPELQELMDTNWLSMGVYAMDLTDDSVPDDNGGWVTIYDVGEIGEYTQSYTGSWQYDDGMLHLTLVPKFDDGYLVDDSFPILMLDGQLWIGRNDMGIGMPHFTDDQLVDVLHQPMG